jgi:ATP-dependent DNA helicase RecQ
MNMTPLECLRRYWGYDSFRPLQQDIVDHIISGQNAIALLPTGGGKSVCFQVPGLLLPGLTVVISPLVALMKDQAARLSSLKIPAAAIYSGMPENEIIETFDLARARELKFLYVSPERIQSRLFLERMSEIQVGLVAIDEAHCISQWGYDFRPEYLLISAWTSGLSGVPVIALTATAKPPVIQDMALHLGLPSYKLFQSSFKRDNLFYHVLHENNKTGRILRICRKLEGSGIIYVRNRKRTMEMAGWLSKQGISAEPYHAGLPLQLRDETQQRWMEGTTRVIVSTNAFGMGIDKPDCRFVLHMDVPDAIEAYFQEAGRAGRDGKTAHAVFLYDQTDIHEATGFLQERFPSVEEIKKTYSALCNYLQIPLGAGADRPFAFALNEFCSHFSLKPAPAFQALQILDRQGLLRFNPEAFHPSKVQIRVAPEKLYDFELKNKKYEPFIKTLLRNHPGIFTEPKAIREFDLARMLNLPKTEVIQMLHMLKKWQLLEYVPSGGASTVVLLEPRMDRAVGSFSVKAYEQRKARATEKLQAMIDFLQQDEICRSEWLLSYFGEKKSGACGTCDVCRNKRKKGFVKEEFSALTSELFSLLKKSQLTVPQLTTAFSIHDDKKILEVIRYWMEMGAIETDNNGYPRAAENPLLD